MRGTESENSIGAKLIGRPIALYDAITALAHRGKPSSMDRSRPPRLESPRADKCLQPVSGRPTTVSDSG